MSYKKEILSSFFDYLQKLNSSIEVSKRGLCVSFTCPVCKNKSGAFSKLTEVFTCFNASCSFKKGSYFDLVRKIKGNNELPEEDILQDIKEVLKLTVDTPKDLEKILAIYANYKFDLVPVVTNDKFPLEKNWTNIEHKNIEEWKEWISYGNNIGIKTGERSGITVIDIDTAIIPDEIAKFKPLENTLSQITNKGFHLIYQYEPELVTTRIDKLKIDILNNGRQFVAYPSVVSGIKRKLVISDIIKMPEEMKQWLLSSMTSVKPTEIAEEVNIVHKTTEELVEATLSTIKEGNRNNTLMHFGGIVRKVLNKNTTENMIRLVNRLFINPSLSVNELNHNVLQQLEKYADIDERDIAMRVLQHLKAVEEAMVLDLKDALELKRDVLDRCLSYLVKEGYVIRKGKNYIPVKRMNWQEQFMSMSNPIQYKMPYLHNYANIRSGDMIVIGGKSGQGKCFGKGTEILMYDGTTKKVENIKEHDVVMGNDSTSRIVTGLSSGKSELFEICPIKGQSFVVNGNHILSLIKHKHIVNISVKDFLCLSPNTQSIHRLYRTGVEFSDKNLELSPYFLGLWLGDGDKDRPVITKPDEEINKYLIDFAISHDSKIKNYRYTSGCSRWAIVQDYKKNNDKNVHIKLKYLNLLNNKHIPLCYKTSSREQRLQLLAGLLDSDGYYSNGGFEISFKDKILAEDTAYIVKSLGLAAYVKEKIQYIQYMKKNYTSYRLHVSGDCSIIPTKIKRKQASKRKQNKNVLVTGFTIKPVGVAEYYGFSVDKNHLFLLGDFTVVHNSHISMNIIKRLVLQGIKPYYISTEANNRFSLIAQQLGLVEGSFFFDIVSRLDSITLEPNAITILDWLLPKDYAATDKVFEALGAQLIEKGGVLIIFVQLREDGSFFAKDMIKFFPSVVLKFMQDEADRLNSYFETTKIRESKTGLQFHKIPCKYDMETKELKTLEEIERGMV